MCNPGNWPAHVAFAWAVKNPDGTPNPAASGTALLAAVASIDAAARQLGHNTTDTVSRYLDPTITRGRIDGALLLPRPEAAGH